MSESSEQSKYEGWAIVEVMGHRVMAGYVKTEYFGSVAMIHVTQPDVPAQERVLDRDQYIIGAGSIYQLTPCSEAAALKRQPETIEIIEKAERKQITGPTPHLSMLPDDDDPHDDDPDDDDDEAPY
jgi:hypothetical protein